MCPTTIRPITAEEKRDAVVELLTTADSKLAAGQAAIGSIRTEIAEALSYVRREHDRRDGGLPEQTKMEVEN